MVRAYLAGDPDAFDVLYQRHHPALVRLLTARLGDRATAEDVAQEVMIRAMRGLERFDPSRPLWPWLRRIALNAAVDVARSRGRSSALADALAGMPPRVGADLSPAEHDVAERDILDRALQEIPPRQRRALERCYVDGWRPTDAAVHFGVGRNAFEQLLHRARGNLRRAYMRHDDHDRAAGLVWLLLWAGWGQQALARGRRVAHVAGESTAQAVAAGLVAASIAVAPMASPPAMTLEPAPAQGREDLGASAPFDQPDALAATAVAPAVVTPADDVAGAGSDAVVPDPLPAPVAADPVAPDDTGAPLPLPVPDPDPAAEPGSDPGTAAQPPASAPEAVGGCGSVVRSVVCGAAGPAAEPAGGAVATDLGLGG